MDMDSMAIGELCWDCGVGGMEEFLCFGAEDRCWLGGACQY